MIFKTRKILTVGIFLAVFAMGLLVSGGEVRAADDSRLWARYKSFLDIYLTPISATINAGAGVINNRFGTNLITNQTATQIFDPTSQDGNLADSKADNVRQLSNSVVTQTTNLRALEKQLTDGQYTMTEEAKVALQKRIDTIKGTIATTNQALNKENTALGEATDKAASTGLLDLLGLAISYVLYGIAYGLGRILMLVTKVMLMVAVFNNFINIAPVAIGWTITRDVCNNFFILLMIAMAIGTTLRVQNYQWRTMLPKVLLAAVLINFSKMLTGLLIDASQVIMLTFAAPLATLTGYNIILASFGLPSLAQLTSVTTQISTDASGAAVRPANLEWVDIFAALIFAIIITIAALAVIVAIAGILCYRIIMLWFLVILSPLWIFGRAFSQLGSITGQWEGEIKKYLITGPVMMFFLYLSFMTMATFGANKGVNYLGLTDGSAKTDIKATPSLTLSESGQNSVNNLSDMASPDGLINVMIVVGLLWGSLMMGQKFGGAGTKLAGSAQGWIKKYTGANLAGSLGKTVSKGIQAAPGAIGTFADDKLGIRSKLYGAAYQAGGKFVPGLNAAIGGKIGALEAGTAKREQAKIDAAGAAAGMNRMTQAQLRSKANSVGASTAQKMAATQALMKNGWMKDDDDVNGANNVKLLDFYRSQLPPELKNTFDNNLKKSNPNLALKSSIYGGGKDIDKLTADIQDGKVKLADLMKDADEATLKALKRGGSNDGLMKWMITNSKDDKEFGTVMAGLSKAAKDALSDEATGVTAANFVSTLAAGPEKDKEQKKLDKMRDAYIRSAKDFRFDQIFGTGEEDKRDNYVSANQSFIAAEVGAGKLDKLMEHVGHVFDPHAIEQIQKRGSEFEAKLKTAFEKIATTLDESALDGTKGADPKERAKNQERERKIMENALLSHSKVDSNSSGRQSGITNILTGKNKNKVLENLAEENIDAYFLRAGVKAGLSETDYKKFNKDKLHAGFSALTGQVGTTVMDPNEQAKIYEQALINGAKVTNGTPYQETAFKAAISGSKRAEILKNISHENIDDKFIMNNLGDLSSKEIGDLGRLSVKHGNALRGGLESKYRTSTVGGINAGNIAQTRTLMSHMASAGAFIDFDGDTDKENAFSDVAGRFNADTLKNINCDDGTGSIDTTQARILADKIDVKSLRGFLQNPGKNKPLADEIVMIIKTKFNLGTATTDQKRKYAVLKSIL